MSGLGDKDVNPFMDPYVVLSQSAGGQNNDTTTATTTYEVPLLDTDKPPEYSSSMPPSTQPAGIMHEVSPIYPVQVDVTMTHPHNPQLNQMELERKATELEAREQELNEKQNMALKVNNFPPIPSFCPLKPCFYHAIDMEIPAGSQKSCKIMFYLWKFYVLTLVVNFISCFALLIAGTSDRAGTTFGVSLIYLFAFTPCSFIFWYRPIYKALRNDNSFNYMLFFFVFLFQMVFCGIYALGIPSFGTAGWINGLAQVSRGSAGVGALMMITGLMWTVLTIGMVLYYKRIHATYRSSGASFEKAQGEFAAGIASNKAVQNVAVESVRAGIAGNDANQNLL